MQGRLRASFFLWPTRGEGTGGFRRSGSAVDGRRRRAETRNPTWKPHDHPGLSGFSIGRLSPPSLGTPTYITSADIVGRVPQSTDAEGGRRQETRHGNPMITPGCRVSRSVGYRLPLSEHRPTMHRKKPHPQGGAPGPKALQNAMKSRRMRRWGSGKSGENIGGIPLLSPFGGVCCRTTT